MTDQTDPKPSYISLEIRSDIFESISGLIHPTNVPKTEEDHRLTELNQQLPMALINTRTCHDCYSQLTHYMMTFPPSLYEPRTARCADCHEDYTKSLRLQPYSRSLNKLLEHHLNRLESGADPTRCLEHPTCQHNADSCLNANQHLDTLTYDQNNRVAGVSLQIEYGNPTVTFDTHYSMLIGKWHDQSGNLQVSRSISEKATQSWLSRFSKATTDPGRN